MALHPSTHAHAHASHATTHAALHAASKVKPSLSADDQNEGGGFAAQLLRAQPAHDKTPKPGDTDARTDAAKKASGGDGNAAGADKEATDTKDAKDAKTPDGTPPAVDPGALVPLAQQIAPPTTSLADKPAQDTDAADLAADPLGALRKAASGKGGKESLVAALGAGKDAKASDATALTGKSAPPAGDLATALAKAEGAANAATDTRDGMAALLPQPDPLTVQAGAIGASPNAVLDPNPPAPQPAAATAHAALPMAPQSPAFMPALGHQIELWMRNGVQHAEVQLSPQDLGPIRVKIEMAGAQARVEMSADVQSTRDALQQALPQLSASLGQVGLSLSGGGVSDQSTFQSQSQSQAQANADGRPGGHAGGGSRTGGAGGDAGEDFAVASAARHAVQRRGLLDMYA
jgi:flagellar hook-length control protein FliK